VAPVPPSLPPPPFKTPFDEQPGTALNLPDWFTTWLAGQRPSRAWLQWFNKLVALPEPFTTYTPVVTAGSGAFTTVSATGRYRRIGKLVFIQITVTITTNGTAAGQVNATLPFTSVNVAGVNHVLTGRANAVSGKSLQGVIGANVSLLNIVNYDNTYPGASGETLALSGFYEVA
jgi:hypothetical protein